MRPFAFIRSSGLKGLLLSALASAYPSMAEAPIGKPAPDFTLTTFDKAEPVVLSKLKGQVMLIDFWASWCAPCKRTLPGLHRIKAELPTVQVLAISVDEDKKKAKRFLTSSHPAGLVTLHDPQSKVAAQYGIEGMPSVILVDKKGLVRFRHDGYTERDLQRMQIELQVLLKEDG